MTTLNIELYGNTHALILRDRGAAFVLFIAAECLPAAEQGKACENVRAGIRRALGLHIDTVTVSGNGTGIVL